MERDVEIRGEMIRLGQLLKLAGRDRRRRPGGRLPRHHAVLVNGEPEQRRGRQLHAGDAVQIGDELLRLTRRVAAARIARHATCPPPLRPHRRDPGRGPSRGGAGVDRRRLPPQSRAPAAGPRSSCRRTLTRTVELHGGAPDTTNNRMEFTAAIEGLRALPAGSRACIVTDSRLMLDSMTKWIAGWKRRGWKTAGGDPVKNQDLVRALEAELARHAAGALALGPRARDGRGARAQGAQRPRRPPRGRRVARRRRLTPRQSRSCSGPAAAETPV